jgi:hypothetical protein
MKLSMHILIKYLSENLDRTLNRNKAEYISELRLTEAILRSDIDDIRLKVDNLIKAKETKE